jgi:glycosyltransferase involved in cell wall biosynthesis
VPFFARTSRSPKVHLINRFGETGGSEGRALELARILSGHADVRLWATGTPSSQLSGPVPIEVIEPRRGRFPRSGTFVFVGVYYSISRWIRLTRPSRRIIVFNVAHPDVFASFERRTARTLTLRPVPCEIVYATDLLRPMLGRPGIVQESPIDIQTFRPRTYQSRGIGAPFRVGRLSRDHPQKFHEDDATLFRVLTEHDIEVRLMGGECLRLAPSPRIMITAPGAQPAADFLHTLDCFVYRARSTWLETFGRVVFEAMACGLPVVVGRPGGYVEYIEHGVNGYLFDTSEEALSYILRLRSDPDLREHLGRNARRTIERLYSSSYEASIVDFYIGRHRVAQQM